MGVSSRGTGIGGSSVFPHTGLNLDNAQPSAKSRGNTAQPYLMRKILEIAQLFDDDPGKLCHTMAALPPLLFISACHILERPLLLVQFGIQD